MLSQNEIKNGSLISTKIITCLFYFIYVKNNLNLYVKVILDRISSDIPNLDDVTNCNTLGAKRRKVTGAIDLL